LIDVMDMNVSEGNSYNTCYTNSLLRILQLYSWIQNTINTTVKRNTRSMQIKN